MPTYRGELAPLAPKFAEDSPARCLNPEEAVELQRDGIDKIKDIVYSKEDDAAIEDWVRQNVSQVETGKTAQLLDHIAARR
jgi:alcohol oxidase